MRACEGCRKRKIKCDAATTNTWPCSACIRLKLQCVPPTVSYDRDFSSTGQHYPEPERVNYDAGSSDDDYHNQVQQQHMNGTSKNIPPIYSQQPSYSNAVGVFQSGHYGEPHPNHNQQHMQYSHLQTPVSIMDQHPQYSPQHVFPGAPLPQPMGPESPESYEQDQYGQQNLADLLGELRMNEAGTGMAAGALLDTG